MKPKVAFGILAGLIVIVGLAAHFLLSNLDHFVVAAVEKYGSETTGTDVRLHGAHIKLADGEGLLSKLTVRNPSGFNTKLAVELGEIDVSIDPSSVTGDGPIIINSVTVTQPKITYEVGANGGTNLDAIKRHADAASPADSGKPARKLIITDLYIKKGEVGISHPLLQGQTLNAPLPDIHLHNIGKSTNGATPGEVAQKIVASIQSSATKVSVPSLSKQLGNIQNLAGSSLSTATKGANSVTKSVKGLFGK